jgi:endonuclease YncB( thermonuclease family)
MEGMLKPIPSLDDPYVYKADLVRILDGDTVRLKLWRPFTAMWDFGFYIKEEINTVRSIEMSCRLFGINTPEIRGVPKDEIVRGHAATAELSRLLGMGILCAKTSKPDKYGRWLVDLWVTDQHGVAIHVNSRLIEGGFAAPYME